MSLQRPLSLTRDVGTQGFMILPLQKPTTDWNGEGGVGKVERAREAGLWDIPSSSPPGAEIFDILR